MRLCSVSIFTLVICKALSFKEDFYKVVRFEKVDDDNFQDKSESGSLEYPFQDTSLSFKDRVDDLVNRLTLEEVVQQLAMGGSGVDGPAPAIERFNIKPYQWDTECLRGYAFAGDATCFPSPIGLAATFDAYLIEKVANVIGWETRAKGNYFMAHKDYDTHRGMSCFSPFINIMRHPLWGRNQETLGEDPYLTGQLSKHYVRGMQGDNDRYALATATCKHFDVHGGPENNPSRFGFNAVITERDWQMTHIPAFRSCLESDPYGVMCSYTAINGVPSCANKKLLTDILRGELGFKGYVTSDEGAIENVDLYFNYTQTPLETAVAVIKAGVSLEVTYVGPKNRFLLLKEAVDKGLVEDNLLRERVKPLFYTRFKLGQFDPLFMNPYSNISLEVVSSPEHLELANTVAAKSFVLLKNNGALPLKKSFKIITVIGPFTNNPEALTGWYPAQFDMDHFSSPYNAIQKFSDNQVTMIKGCVGDKWDKNLPKCPDFSEPDISSNVPGSDLIVVTLGTGLGLETEGLDRTTIQLPGKQLDMLKSVVKFADKSAKIIVLLFNAGPLDVSFAKQSLSIDAMIACHFPAQSAGEAIYRILSGQENPAGRLPNTWPKSLDQVPPITNYSMHERTYRYSTSEPLYSFGYGLSYTTFIYSKLNVGGSQFNICDVIGVSVSVTNNGKYYGEEVTQIYIKWEDASAPTANIQLVGFKRIGLKSGETKVVYFIIKPVQRAVWIDSLMLEPGRISIFAGGQQPNQKTRAPSNVLDAEFIVKGEVTDLKKCSI